MRCVLVGAWILILAKAVQTQESCRLVPDQIHEQNREFRHFICGKIFFDENDCAYSSVEVLKIQYCPVESIEFEFIGYENVHTLDISFSHYATLGYLHLNFEHLKRFNASHNNLTDIPELLFNNTKQLTEVDFSHNQFKTFYVAIFSKVPKLSIINISHNHIEGISSRLFNGLFDLEVLDLSDNQIEDVQRDAFIDNIKLKTLNLKNNPIQQLDCVITHLMNGMTTIAVSSKHLTTFDLSCANHMDWTSNEEEIIFMNEKNKNELRLSRTDFANLFMLSFRGNRFRNPLGAVNMFGKSVQQLDLSGNHLGQLNETTFHGFNNLESLDLIETNLSFGESNPFERLNNLERLDISFNNLRTLNITCLSKTLNNLVWFEAAGNQFDNGLEIIQSLRPDLNGLDLSENFIGALNRSTFEHFKELTVLNLSGTHLEHFDVNPFKVDELDISRNKLKRLNVTLLASMLNGLGGFYASENEFENTAEIIEHLGSDLHKLDLTGSYVAKLDETTFKRTPQVYSLGLRRTNLSISDFKPFEAIHQLISLDISSNGLTELNFSPQNFSMLEEIDLSENHLTRLNGLTKHSYPYLVTFDITNNRLNCSHISILTSEWKELEVIGNPCDQFDINETHSQTETNTEISTMKYITQSSASIANVQTESDIDTQTDSIIATTTSAPTTSSVVLYSVPIGVLCIVIINVIGVVVFLRRKSSSRNRNQLTVSYHANENGEEQQPEPPPRPGEQAKPEDHLYEEIEEREQPYDRLRFEFSPMPISTENQHYHNFTLANRATES